MIFICDTMLGKLARYLRILGFDAPYVRQHEPRPDMPGDVVFLTRKKESTGPAKTVIITANDPRDQLLEIKDLLDRHVDPVRFMTRCLDCNTPLAAAKKEDIEPFVPEYVYHHHTRFTVCPTCRKVYWEGSHADEMHSFIDAVTGGS